MPCPIHDASPGLVTENMTHEDAIKALATGKLRLFWIGLMVGFRVGRVGLCRVGRRVHGGVHGGFRVGFRDGFGSGSG